ncbi:MAG: hypothetical protein ACYS1C_02410 [Planctomycetota bacterium]|jgi:hypothetical protein
MSECTADEQGPRISQLRQAIHAELTRDPAREVGDAQSTPDMDQALISKEDDRKLQDFEQKARDMLCGAYAGPPRTDLSPDMYREEYEERLCALDDYLAKEESALMGTD